MKFSALLHRCDQLIVDTYRLADTDNALCRHRQVAVLSALSDHPHCSQTDLVRFTGIDRSTIGQMLVTLTSDGIVARERDTSDMRTSVLKLTAHGAKALRKSAMALAAVEAKLLAHLTHAERNRLMEMLGVIATQIVEPIAARRRRLKRRPLRVKSRVRHARR